MASFTCGVCGARHDHLPMAISYRRPAHFLALPPAERAARARCDDDLCVVDGRDFLIRGVLELPIKGSDTHFEFGPWAQVEEPDFVRYLGTWEHEIADSTPSFSGHLAGEIGAYPGSDRLLVRIQLRDGNRRPLFHVAAPDHPLAVDQREGITMEQVHTIVADLLPGTADSETGRR